MARLVLLSALISSRSLACYIQGVDSGVCRSASELIDNGDINYCASSITGVYDSVCVPREFGGKGFQFTTQSEFSFGLFPNHTVKAKDKWIAKYTTNAISRRKEVESANGALSMRASAREPAHFTDFGVKPCTPHPLSRLPLPPPAAAPQPHSSNSPVGGRIGQNPHSLHKER